MDSWREAVGACVKDAIATALAKDRTLSLENIATRAGIDRTLIPKLEKGKFGQIRKVEKILDSLGLRIAATCVPKDSPPVTLTVTPADKAHQRKVDSAASPEESMPTSDLERLVMLARSIPPEWASEAWFVLNEWASTQRRGLHQDGQDDGST